MIALLLAVSLLDGAGNPLVGDVFVDGRGCPAIECELEPGRHVLQFEGRFYAFHLAADQIELRVLPALDIASFGVGMRRQTPLPPNPELRPIDLGETRLLAYQLNGELPSHLRVARHAENNCSNPIQRIDSVPLESYVAGVVHGEIGIFRAAGSGDGVQIPAAQVDRRVLASFQTFALAARTYALWWYLRKGAEADFHIHDGPCNQVYQDARDPVSEQAAQSTSGQILVPRHDHAEIDKHEYASSCARHGTLPSYRNAHDVRREDIVPDEGLDRVCVRTWCGHDNYRMAHQDNPFLDAGNRCLVRGICQWGSLERSVRGDGFEEILNHYQPDLVVHQPGSEVITGSVRGNILDADEAAIGGARIIVFRGELERTEFADRNGNYALVGLEPGQWRAQVDAQGYRRAEGVVSVVAGDTTWRHFVLQREDAVSDAGTVPPGADAGQTADGGFENRDAATRRGEAGRMPTTPEPPGACGCSGGGLAEGLWIFALICLRRSRRRA